MFARFDKNPAMTLQDIKKKQRYRRTDGCTHAPTDNVKTVYPPQTKFAGGITILFQGSRGGPAFSSGGGVQILISIEPQITCDFRGGGVPTPYPHCGSAHKHRGSNTDRNRKKHDDKASPRGECSPFIE